MSDVTTARIGQTGAKDDPAAVFRAAKWLDQLWNSSGTAVSPELVEWRCLSSGSGRGRSDWRDWGLFSLVAEVFGLGTCSDWDTSDELIVYVPVDRFEEVARLIRRLGENNERWPWLSPGLEFDEQVRVAAEVLGMSVAEVESSDYRLDALHIEY